MIKWYASLSSLGFSANLFQLLTAVQNYREGHFTPYESPLKQFNSYRYNPNYLSDVPGGFRSLTFSHNINPNKPICRWELAGGTCNDDSCDSQHFRSMGLSGAF